MQDYQQSPVPSQVGSVGASEVQLSQPFLYGGHNGPMSTRYAVYGHPTPPPCAGSAVAAASTAPLASTGLAEWQLPAPHH